LTHLNVSMYPILVLMHDEQTLTILKALADPTRLDIIRYLTCQKDGSPCSTVRSQSQLSQPTMSHHLSKLVEAGLVRERKDGKEKVYELDSALLLSHGLDPNKL
jgi:DNA-binding transcriptional ArsR family regulator